jgi:ABC-type multidrug transport system fused ATPase/permease subunit
MAGEKEDINYNLSYDNNYEIYLEQLSREELIVKLNKNKDRINSLKNDYNSILHDLNLKNEDYLNLQKEYQNTSEHLNQLYINIEEIKNDANEKIEHINDLESKVDNFNKENKKLNDEISNFLDLKKEQRRKLINSILVLFLIPTAVISLVFFTYMNPEIYEVQDETKFFISQGINAAVLLIIPFIFGTLAALTRVLISEIPVLKNTFLITASGLMSMFSWIGIKSGIMAALLDVQDKNQILSSSSLLSPDSFYKMALVAIIVGMFSSSIFVYVQEKVERITKSTQ